jgi:hypothetical protein
VERETSSAASFGIRGYSGILRGRALRPAVAVNPSQGLCQVSFAQCSKTPFGRTPESRGDAHCRAICDLLHLRAISPASGHRHGRRVRPDFSGACSFRDFSGRESGEFDHLVNSGETGRAMKYNAELCLLNLHQSQAHRESTQLPVQGDFGHGQAS